MIRSVIEQIQADKWYNHSQAVDIAKGALQRPHTWTEFINWFKRRKTWQRK